jgi:ribose transport system substrate-binding protein
MCAVALFSTTALTACGSSDDDGAAASTTAKAAPASTVASVPFDTPAAKLPAAYPEPQVKAGVTWRLGILEAAPDSYVTTVTRAAKSEAERLGAKVTVLSANFNLDTQVSQCNQLVTQKVDAITVSALDPNALSPCLKRAQAAGIAVIGQDAPAIAGEPLSPGVDSSVLQGADEARYLLAKAAAEAHPGAGFALLGVAIPVQILQYGMARQKYWAERFGLKFVTRADDRSGTGDGAATAMNTIVNKSDDVDVVFTYNDASAASASITARSSGRSGIAIYGDTGESSAIDKVKSGQLAGTILIGATEVGKQAADGAYNMVTKQNLPLPEQVAPKNTLVTKANAATVTPLAAR